jgi:serine/threonine protein phosphatase PrpC
MGIRPGIEMASLSDLGCQRQNNEDCYSYWEPMSDEEFLRKGRLAMVADGMGGYKGGQEASRLAVDTVEQVYASTLDSDPQALLTAGFIAAHQRIQDQANKDPGLRGMGTTCTAIALLGNNLYYAHVGDSRLYMVRDGSMSLLTRDHSYVSRLVEDGILRAEEAESHPQRHILTAALGSGDEVFPDTAQEPIGLEKNDVLLFCTDGLWGVVGEKEIKSAAAVQPEQACKALVSLAKQRGGPDNITVQLLRISQMTQNNSAEWKMAAHPQSGRYVNPSVSD